MGGDFQEKGRFKMTRTQLGVIAGLFHFCLALTAVAIQRTGLKPGFRDLNWGAHPPSTMTLIESTPDGCRVYRRPSDVHMIGDALAESITYSFCARGFTRVLIVPMPAFAGMLLEELTSAWGKSKTEVVDRDTERFVWVSGDSKAMLTLKKIEGHDIYFGGELVMFSRSRFKRDDGRKKRTINDL